MAINDLFDDCEAQARAGLGLIEPDFGLVRQGIGHQAHGHHRLGGQRRDEEGERGREERAERDADPLTCDGQQFLTTSSLPDWVDLD